MYEVFEQLCRENGVTPYKVCKATGITTGSISNWKNGRYSPKTEKLQKIAEYFGVTVEYLTTGKQPEDYYLNDETAKIAQEVFDRKELRMLFDAARDCKPEHIKIAEDLLNKLKETNPDG